MILQGSIERFDLGSVLQFLAQNAATGILEIRDFEEHGCIYLVKGRLEAISLPLSDDRLGVYLVKAGVLSDGQLARALMEEADADSGEGRKALGQRLVERGFTNEGTIREAMCRLTMARMFELAHWRKGVFTYDEPDEMPDFRICIHGDVQELLLQTQLRIDHGDRPRKLMTHIDAGPCQECSVADCSPAVKLKYLKKDMCLWRSMSSSPAARPEPRAVSDPLSAYGGGKGDGEPQGTWVQF